MGIGDHERPALTADTVALREEAGQLQVLLVKRGRPPFEGSWALPGGFVDAFELPEAAARRELAEETGLTLGAGVPFALVGVYGEPGRDPRGWTVSVVFAARAPEDAPSVTGSDDAADARWFPVESLPRPLAFDHDTVVADAMRVFDTGGRSVLD
jgi:8-oxo-dGTP diphosphatase